MAVDDLLLFDTQSTYGAIALEYDYASQHYGSFATQHALQLAGIAPGMSVLDACLLYTSPSPRDGLLSRMPSSA